VGHSQEGVSVVRYGREFFKMSGSGNDFVVIDARKDPPDALETADVIRRVCARGTGVGADGLVLLEPPVTPGALFRMRYFNSDGSLASLCGNASLCSTRLAVELGAAAHGEGFSFDSDAGLISARLRQGEPEVDLQPVIEVRTAAEPALEAGERRIGFALVGVPHLVVLGDDLEAVDVRRRGSALRRHPALGQAGANINFVAQTGGEWGYRTFERGVEEETLACGTGAVATGLMLSLWGLAGVETTLRTRSGRPVTVRLERHGDGWSPSLRGEGRIVFRGALGELG
jgi:diaminopimelate epimerase